MSYENAISEIELMPKRKNIQFNIFATIVIFLIAINDFLTYNIDGTFKFANDGFVIALVLSAILKIYKSQIISLTDNEVLQIKLLSIVVCCGLISGYIYQYQSAVASMYDLIVFVKGFATYYSTRILFRDVNISLYSDRMLRFVFVLFYLLVISTVLDKIFSIFPHRESFFIGLSETQLWFVHPSRLAFCLEIIFCMMYALSRRRENTASMICVIILGFATLLQKYFVFSFVGVLLLSNRSNLDKLKFNIVTLISIVLLMIVVIYVISVDKFLLYFSTQALDSGFARAVLTIVSAQISYNHFPFGSGFGTFASFVSGTYYSPLYYEYGIDKIYGLTEDDPMFIADVYWPMVLAQFGIVGFAVFLLFIINFGKNLISDFNYYSDYDIRSLSVSALFIFLILLIDSFADQIFSQNRAVVAFFIMALFVNQTIFLKSRFLD